MQGHFDFDGVFSDKNKLNVQNGFKNVPPIWKINGSKIRQAAVLIPLCIINNKPSILYCLRSMNIGSHRGQACFPGGVQEKNESIIQTALRETEEEIGLKIDISQVWGTFGGYISERRNTYITPVVAFIGQLDWNEISHNSDEVFMTFARSLEYFCSPGNIGYTAFRNQKHDNYRSYQLPVFGCRSGDLPKIWGVTALLTYQLLKLLIPNNFVGNAVTASNYRRF